ncbi:MAG: TatD family hydrolase [Oscillospiraceae bacterium]|nr:TatD family hydrolase [Oscillospiraceae bacterium]
MIETDAPYLLPRGYKLKNPNLPQYLPYIAARIAKEKDIDTLTQTFLENTVRFFGIR